MVNSNTVNSKFHLIRIFNKVSVNIFSIISCLKYTVNSNFHLIRSKTMPTNDFELTVPDLYYKRYGRLFDVYFFYLIMSMKCQFGKLIFLLIRKHLRVN